MSTDGVRQLTRFVVKLYAPEPFPPKEDAAAFVPIFHDWIRDAAIPDLVLFDVADYAHVPEGPGIVLVAHEASFALDRGEGRFGLLGQRRIDFAGPAADALATLIRQSLAVASRLEEDPRLFNKLRFDRRSLRIEVNDRLGAPNSDAGYASVRSIVQAALGVIAPGVDGSLERVQNDPRDRLAVEVRLNVPLDLGAVTAS